MRAWAKALILSLVLTSAVSTARTAKADPLAALSFVTDSGAPSQTWKLFQSSFSAGDAVTVVWRGPAHLRLSVWDRDAGTQTLDKSGAPVVFQYTGNTSIFSTNTMTVHIPVDVPNAMLVVKNPDVSTGLALFYVYSYDAMRLTTPPAMLIFWPSLSPTNAGQTLATFGTMDLGDVAATHVYTKLLYVAPYSNSITTVADDGLQDATIRPGQIVPGTVHIPAGVFCYCLQISTTTYGETSNANYNFYLNY